MGDTSTRIDKREMMRGFDDQALYYGSAAHLTTVGERVQIGVERSAILDAIISLRFARALDVGCGPGWYLMEVSKRGKTIGLDFSWDMAKVAKKSGKPVEVVRADMEFFPFRNNSFDLIYSVRVMKYLENRSKFILEAQRICDKGGRILLYDIRHLGVAYLALKMYILLRKIIPPEHHPQPHQLERLMPLQIRALLGRSGRFRVRSRGVLFMPWLMYRHITSPKILRLLVLLDRLLAKAPFSQYLAYSVLYTAIDSSRGGS